MPIAKNPNRNPHRDEREDQFIAGAGRGPRAPIVRKQPIMVRVGPEMIQRIDAAAKRLGISRSAFIVSSTAERLERMEGPRSPR